MYHALSLLSISILLLLKVPNFPNWYDYDSRLCKTHFLLLLLFSRVESSLAILIKIPVGAFYRSANSIIISRKEEGGIIIRDPLFLIIS